MSRITAWVLAQYMTDTDDADLQPATGDNATVVSWYSAWSGRRVYKEFGTQQAAADMVATLKHKTQLGICQIRVNGKAA